MTGWGGVGKIAPLWGIPGGFVADEAGEVVGALATLREGRSGLA